MTGPEVRARPRWPGNPFRGLGVFEYWHEPIYCGRTAAIEEVTKAVSDLLGAVGHQREGGEPQFPGESGEIISSNGSVVETKSAFVLIFGASGSGKSSLIRAGVMPMLSEGKGIEGVSLWRCAVVKPSEGNGNLAFALASALVQPAQAALTEEERRLSSLTRPAALPELLADGRKTIELSQRTWITSPNVQRTWLILGFPWQ